MFKILSFVGLLSFIGSTFAQYQPTARLFSSKGCSGSFVTISAGNYVNDLTQLGFNNRAYSVSLRGPWVFFDLVNFNTASEAATEYIFESNEKCVNFVYLGGAVSSLKFVGHESDYRTDTITFYEFTNFQGAEEYSQYDVANLYDLRNRVSSFVVTGSSGWTIYDQTNYRGTGICVRPSSNYVPAFHPNTLLLNPPFPHGAIASARRGCSGRDFVTISGSVDGSSVHGKSVPSDIPFFRNTVQND